VAPSKHVWNPAHHPRDARGRFTKSATRVLKATDAKKAKAAVAGFKPTDLGPGAANGPEWIKRQASATKAADDAVARYFAGGWKTTHQTLRTKKDATTDPDVIAIDKAMHPLTDDVMLERRVSLKMFAHIPLEQLQGMKVRDAAYQPTALQGSQGEAPDGMVTIHMAVPAGTKAIVNPDTGAIVLDRDTETAISRVEPNGRGGYDLYGIVIPKAGAVKPDPTDGDTVAPSSGNNREEPGSTADVGAQDDTDTAGGSAAAGGTNTRRSSSTTAPTDIDRSGSGTDGADKGQDDKGTAPRPRKAAASTAGTRTPGQRRTAAQGGQDAGDGAQDDDATAPDAAQVADAAADHERVTGRPAPTRVSELERNDHVRVVGDSPIGRTTITGYVSTPNLVDDQTWVTVSQFPDLQGRRTNLRVDPDAPVYVQPHPDPADVVIYKTPKTGRPAPKATYVEHIRGQVVRDPEREATAKARIAELSGVNAPPAQVDAPPAGPDTAPVRPNPREDPEGYVRSLNDDELTRLTATRGVLPRVKKAVAAEQARREAESTAGTSTPRRDNPAYQAAYEQGWADAASDDLPDNPPESEGWAHGFDDAFTGAEKWTRADRADRADADATAAAAARPAPTQKSLDDHGSPAAAWYHGAGDQPEGTGQWVTIRQREPNADGLPRDTEIIDPDNGQIIEYLPANRKVWLSTEPATDNGEVPQPDTGTSTPAADPDQGASARIGDRITRPVDELLANPTIGPSPYSDAAEARTWPAELSVPDVAQTLDVDGRKIAIVRYRTLTMPTAADTPTLGWTDQFYAVPADTEFRPLRMSHLTQEHHGQPAGSAAAGVSSTTAFPTGPHRSAHIASGKTANAAASGARAKIEKEAAREKYAPAARANIGVHDKADFDRLDPNAQINPGDLVVLRVFNKLRTGVATKVTANKVDALVSTPSGAVDNWYGTAQKGVGVRLLRSASAAAAPAGRLLTPDERADDVEVTDATGNTIGYAQQRRNGTWDATPSGHVGQRTNHATPDEAAQALRDRAQAEQDREAAIRRANPSFPPADQRVSSTPAAGTDAPAAPALDAAEERAAIAGRVFAQGQLDDVAPDDTRFRMRRARVGNRELDVYDEQGTPLGILHQQPGRDGWLTLPAHGRAGVTAPTFADAVASLRAGEVSPEATPAVPTPAAPSVDPGQRREQIADSMAGAQAKEIADAVDTAIDKAEPADPVDARKAALEAKRAELDAARKATETVPMFGGSSKRKSFAVRVDANIRRTAEAFRNVERLEREVKALERPPVATAPQGGWTPEQLAGARVIRTRLGWHEVVKVNQKSVKVKAAPGMDDLVSYKRIIDARDPNGAKVNTPAPDAGADNIEPKATPDASTAGTSAPAVDLADVRVSDMVKVDGAWAVVTKLRAGEHVDGADLQVRRTDGTGESTEWIDASQLEGHERRPDAPAAGTGNPDAVSVTRQADPFTLVGDAATDDVDTAFGPTTPPTPAAPAVDVDSIAVDDEVRVAGQWATVTAKVDGQIRVRFPDDRLTLVNPADVRQHRPVVRVEDMFGGTTTFVPQDRATIGVATRADVGRTRGQQDVQQVSMFDVADQVQIEGQEALLDMFFQAPTAEPPASVPLLPVDAPEPTRVDVPDDLTGWTDEQLAGLFAEVVAQPEYDEDGTLRITSEWDRREQEMNALLGMVPEDLTTLDDDAAAVLFAELTSHHGTMDTEQVARLEADLDRRDAELVAGIADLEAKRALVALPVDQHADEDALMSALGAAGDLGDEEASVRILDEIDRRDQAQRERETAEAAEVHARQVADVQAREREAAAVAAVANAREMDAPAEARLIVLEDLIGQANDAEDVANAATDRDAAAEPGMADVSQSDLYATVITKMGSPDAQAAQREIARREAAEARSLQTLENRRARRRLLNRDLSELTEDELTSLPALLDTLPGEDGATFRGQKLADLRAEVTRRQQALDDKAARRAAGPDRNYRRADPVTEYTELDYHFGSLHGEDAGRWQEAKELALGLQRQPDQFSSRPRPVPHKDWKKAVQASPRPWPDIAHSAVAWYRHLTEIDAPEQAGDGRARDYSTHGGWPSQPDAPDLLDPIAPADVAKADMVLYDMRSKAIGHRNGQGDESTYRRYVLAEARAYRIPHNPTASLAELRESGVEKSAGTAFARDPRSPQKAAADVIAEFRRLAAEDGVDPADTERFGPPDRKSTARRAARGELTGDQQSRIQAHLARGLTWEQAYAEAIGVDETVIRRQQADDLIRQTFTPNAKDLAAAYRVAYTDHVMAAYQAAEDGTRGHLLNDAGKQLQARGDLSAVSLFSGPSTRAYKYASEELKRWWGSHPPPRLTFAEWKANMQGDPSAMAAAIQKAKGNEFA
jgi:hypothetical protein